MENDKKECSCPACQAGIPSVEKRIIPVDSNSYIIAPVRKTHLVGLDCYNHRFGCDCTADVPAEVKIEFKKKYGIDYYSHCYYTFVDADDEGNITLNMCLHQQGATEYENAKEIWVDYEIID